MRWFCPPHRPSRSALPRRPHLRREAVPQGLGHPQAGRSIPDDLSHVLASGELTDPRSAGLTAGRPSIRTSRTNGSHSELGLAVPLRARVAAALRAAKRRFRPRASSLRLRLSAAFAPASFIRFDHRTTFGRSRIVQMVWVEIRSKSCILWQVGHRITRLLIPLLSRLQSR